MSRRARFLRHDLDQGVPELDAPERSSRSPGLSRVKRPFLERRRCRQKTRATTVWRSRRGEVGPSDARALAELARTDAHNHRPIAGDTASYCGWSTGHLGFACVRALGSIANRLTSGLRPRLDTRVGVRRLTRHRVRLIRVLKMPLRHGPQRIAKFVVVVAVDSGLCRLGKLEPRTK